MRVTLTSEAEGELVDARDWYHAQAPGTGLRFMTEYRALATRLADNPRQFPIVRGEMRRAGFQHFPYGLYFRIRADEVEIFACFYGPRNPRQGQRHGQ
jgi:plasmid stabilization system protein ParE